MKFRQTMILLSFGVVPAVTMADLSANIGFVSDYVFRGIYQAPSSASAGIDYEHDSGFYIGTWGADVGDGLETDVYFGYGGDVAEFSWDVGFTGYYYSDLFDNTYEEVNLGIGYSFLSLDFTVGGYDDPDPTMPDEYTFASLTLEVPNGPYFTFGSWGDEFTGDYVEVGYGFEWNGFDLSIALISSDDLVLSEVNQLAEYNLVFGISKGIAIGD